MIQVPADLAKLYTSFMEQKGVETDQHRYYIKRKQAHHAVSLFYEMGHLSGRKTRNGTSYGKSAAYGRTEPEVFLLFLIPKKWRLIKEFSLAVKYNTPDQ